MACSTAALGCESLSEILKRNHSRGRLCYMLKILFAVFALFVVSFLTDY